MFKSKIILASGNEKKCKELNELLQPFKVIPQSHYAIADIPETGLSFVENALLKARHASEKSGLPAIADDSGLIVPVLNGEPGIYSARYAGIPQNSTKNIKKLLDNLKNNTHREAFFYCSIVFLTHPNDPAPLIAEGRWDGLILHEPKGNNGFGYDPIFWDPQFQRSAAELSLSEKHQVSHRGKAIRQLLSYFTSVSG